MRITLEQAGARTSPDWAPIWEGRQAIVTGQASVRPITAFGAISLPIQDGAAHGLLLQGTKQQFDQVEPGDWVEAQGTVGRSAGLPVLLTQQVRRLSRSAPPSPQALKVGDLNTFRYLGVLVSTEGFVQQQKEGQGGDLISIGEKGASINLFLPRARRDSGPQLSGLHVGDRVRVTGIANQYCTLPPYDSFFQVLLPSPAAVATLDKAWMIPPPFLLASLVAAGALLAIWWIRERRMAALRRQMHFLNALGEEVIGASSPAEILRRLTLTLPELSNASGISLYIQNRGAKMLESVHTAGAAVESIDLEAPENALASLIAECFRTRALAAIPDSRRNAVFQKDETAQAPRSLLLAPMIAQSELMGVLVLYHSENFHYFSHSEQAAMQHLANQVATALKLQEQRSIREQLFRSEKLAAAGQLISDVAGELRSPLESIMRRAEGAHPDLPSIAQEARQASGIVARLVSFAKVEPSEAQPVDVNGVLAGLLKFRIPESKAKGLEIRSQLAQKRATVMGSRGQLEQVLLNLLVDAEKSATETGEKNIAVTSSLLAKRVLIEITYPTRSSEFQRSDGVDGDPAGSEALGLGVCRGIVQSHGGEFRMVRTSLTQARFDVELPLVESYAANVELHQGTRQMTVLIVEPDTKVQRQLVQLLGHRGDRVVPVTSAEEAGDLAQRVRFDMVICAVRLPGLNWVELFERVRHQVGGFVLLTDGFDIQSERAFQGNEGLVLKKPLDEAEVHRICRMVEDRAAVVG
ncbi:MAG TPA: GAF domain-containing protein [Bryobacteraceae bacterium]|nr:GAF domain-containing protein [Bryobacteraceae bacterium]